MIVYLENIFCNKTSRKLSKQWNHKKNYPLTPEMFEPKSGKTVWWICKNNHEWEASIDKRSNGRNCPYCTNKKVGYGNSLADVTSYCFRMG